MLGLFFAAFGIFVLSAILFFAPGSSSVLISVGFASFGILFFAIPIILLYVYDKNNGVLEYLLSLGWNQDDVFKRYLKASLFLAFIVFIGEFAIIAIVSAIAGLATLILGLIISAVIAALSFSAVSLSTISMMAFSSLQKQRVGANSPLGLALGAFVILPTYYVPIFLPFDYSVLFDLLIAALAGALSIVLLILSSRLIRREKMLP
jgi:magnesium-transporting ATPase (P-type)